MQIPFKESFNKLEIPAKDGELELYEHFLNPLEAEQLLKYLIEHTNWEQGEITLFGKTHKEPRLRKSYGDKNYAYSNSLLLAEKPPLTLKKLQEKIELVTHTKYNSMLINYYRDGNDSMGWHQDNEKELGQNPVIASLSIGETRTFQLKHITDKSINTIKIPLTTGALLIMKGKTQHYWKHQIPKTKKKLQPRINITFRLIK